jgi:DNA-binding transcriptional regulator of glucitol operon
VRRLLTPGWLLRHALAVGLVVAFLLLARWQIGRAAGGNMLSYGYAVEWPVFAGFVIFVWIKEMRRTLRAGRTRPGEDQAGVQPEAGRTWAARRQRSDSAYDDSADPELAAYNRYLAWVNANPQASPMDYPG